MSRYTIRVELHAANNKDYEVLHEGLGYRGFVDWIASPEGHKLRLPPAEYNFVGDATRHDVYRLAHASATATGCKFAILVTESAGRTWYGLEAA